MSQIISKQATIDECTRASARWVVASLLGPVLLVVVLPPLVLLGWPALHLARWRRLIIGFRLLGRPVLPTEPPLATGDAWGWLLVLLVVELLCLGLVIALAASDPSDFSLNTH